MDWHDAIAGGIPSDPDPGTPQLRSDISDELNDHLACAMQRELRRTDDEAAAHKAVIERFGDPRSIARELWWGAVKERVMKNRILLAIAVLAIVACFGSTFIAYVAMQRERQAREAAMQQMEAARQAYDAQMAAQQAAQSKANAAVADWAHLKVQVVLDAPGNPPAPDVRVSVTGKLFNNDDNTLSLKTDASGMVEFGPIKPGVVKVGAQTEEIRLMGEPSVVIYPGTHQETRIIQPVLDRRTGRLRLELKWPDDKLPEEGVLRVKMDDEYIAPNIPNPSMWRTFANRELLIDLTGRDLNLNQVIVKGEYLFEKKGDPQETVELPVGKYTINSLTGCLLLPTESGHLRLKLGGSPFAKFEFEIKAGEETKVIIDDLDGVLNAIKVVRQNVDHPPGVRPGRP